MGIKARLGAASERQYDGLLDIASLGGAVGIIQVVRRDDVLLRRTPHEHLNWPVGVRVDSAVVGPRLSQHLCYTEPEITKAFQLRT